MIPFSSPHAQYVAHRTQIDEAIRRVLDSGRYILGPEVAAFEEEFATWQGRAHCVGVGNGTDALTLALAGLGIGPGDEVITVSHTAIATVVGIERSGATAVLADVTPDTLTMAPEALHELIGPRTKALVPVHLYGHPADMPAIMRVAERHGLAVVEDCAQAHGASLDGVQAGNYGHAACFSFYPTKNLGAIGDGGAVVTSDPALNQRLRRMREYGWAERVSVEAGLNTRLDEIQAAILRVKLPHLDADNARRAEIAAAYSNGLAGLGLKLPTVRPGARHAFHLYVVRSPERDRIAAQLRAAGIGTAVHYPLAAHQQPAYARLARSLPETERAAAQVLSLPMYPELSAAQVQQVIQAARSAVR